MTSPGQASITPAESSEHEASNFGSADARAPHSILHGSVLGEYFALSMMAFGGCGAVAWIMLAGGTRTAWLMSAAGVWLLVRFTGTFAGRWLALCATSMATAAVTIATVGEADVSHAVLRAVSPQAFLFTLGLTLVLDVIDISRRFTGEAWGTFARRVRTMSLKSVICGLLLTCVVFYMVVFPSAAWVVSQLQPPRSGVVEEMSLVERIRVHTTEAFIAVWFFAFGAAIGSFLNVVAYRLPRAESLIVERSRCPGCSAPIVLRDNIPILGWWLLGGRCRSCQTRISLRYPLVEIVTAGVFLLLYFVELISGGQNIPVRQPNYYRGVVWVLLYTKWDLVRLYLYHCFSISVLLSWVLIDWDRHRIPPRAIMFVASLLVGAAILFPDLLPVAFAPQAKRWLSEAWLVSGASSLLGGFAGVCFGWLLGRDGRIRVAGSDALAAPLARQPSGCWNASSSLGLAGLALGWQAIVTIAALTLAMQLLARMLARGFIKLHPPTTCLIILAVLLHHVAWREISQRIGSLVSTLFSSR